MVVADFSSFYSLLIVVPEVTECYETMNILKYYDFPINIDEDNIMKPEIKKEMGFHKEDQVNNYNSILIHFLVPYVNSRFIKLRNA